MHKIFHNIPYANMRCKRNTVMSPLSKVDVSLSGLLGQPKGWRNGTGDNDKKGVRAAGDHRRRGRRPVDCKQGYGAVGAVATAGFPPAQSFSIHRPAWAGIAKARSAEQSADSPRCAPNGDDAREAVLHRLRPDARR